MNRAARFACAALAICVPALAAAGLREDLNACLETTDNAKRLACYDALALRAAGAPRESRAEATAPAAAQPQPAPPAATPTTAAAPTAAVPPAPAAAAAAPSAKQDFGAETIPSEPAPEVAVNKPPAPEDLEELHARILGKANAWGRTTQWKLDNGQVWRTRGDGSAEHDYPEIPENPAVTIRKGFLGSYWLQFDGTGVRVAVTRVEPESRATAAAPPAPAVAAAAPSPEQHFGTETIPPPEPPPQVAVNTSKESEDLEELHARIVGNANAWGRTAQWKLDNGQVWRTRGDGSAEHDYPEIPENPAVTIRKGFLGSYWLQFDGTGVRVAVTRVQ